MFNINGEEWRVVRVDPLHSSLLMSNGEYTIGTCDDTEKTIYIANNLNDKLTKKVLAHEVSHAAMFSYDIELNFSQEELLANLIATYGQEIVAITNKIFNRLNENREPY